MSELKIFGGIYDDEKRIIDNELVECVSLQEGEVRVLTTNGNIFGFRTDLTTIEQVRLCLDTKYVTNFKLESVVAWLKNLEGASNALASDSDLQDLGLKRVDGEIVPIKEGE